MAKLTEWVKEDIESFLTENHNSCKLEDLSEVQLLDYWLIWNGIIGYAGEILAVIDHIKQFTEDVRVERELAAWAKDNGVEEVRKRRVKIVNLTPHRIGIITDGPAVLEIPTSSMTARVETVKETSVMPLSIEGLPVPVLVKKAQKVIFLDDSSNRLPEPEQKVGTIYIVSTQVLEVAQRWDFVAPGETLKQRGSIVGVNSFIALI